MKYEKLRRELVRFGKRIADEHLVVGPGGNMSARSRNVMLIKASGVPFEEVKEEDYIPVGIASGKVLEKRGRPSSELPMHLACYRVRDDVKAVVHTHSPFATGVASAGVTLRPMFPDFVAIIGSDVPTLPFAMPCGEEIAELVSGAIVKANAALLGNHGIIAVGHNLREAFYRAMLVEAAAQALVAGTSVGKMRFLNREEVAKIRALSQVQYRVNLLKKGE
ncbi:class II aldolase/adducin family protein [bacterium]|nr:class II aldolase/adducin family protein [bacterium]